MLFCPYREDLKNISVAKFIFIKVEGLHLSNLHEMNIFTGIFQLFLQNVQKSWFVEIQSQCLFFIFIETALVQIALVHNLDHWFKTFKIYSKSFMIEQLFSRKVVLTEHIQRLN